MPEVYALHCELSPLPGRDPMQAMTAALYEWVRVRVPDITRLEFDAPATVHATDGSILRWEPFHDGQRHLLDFTWRHFDAESRSISWSTRVAYLEIDERLGLSVQVANTGPELSTGRPLLTTRPRLLVHLAEHFSLRSDGYVSKLQPDIIAASQVPSVVHYELFDQERRAPIVVLSPRGDGSFAVEPTQLANEFLSLAKVYCIADQAATFALTRTIGDKRLSCFNGALRVYLPGLRIGADPFVHPLMFGHRLAESRERYRLAQYLALLTTRRFQRDPKVLELRDLRAIEDGKRLKVLIADLEEKRALATEQGDWVQLAEMAWEENKKVSDELEDMRDRMRVAEAKMFWLEGERRRLMIAGKEQPEAATPEALDLPINTVEDAVEAVSQIQGDSLFFLPSAFESARQSTYRRPDEVYKALEALGEVAERILAGTLGTTPRDALRALGQDYAVGLSENTPKKLRRQYEFTYRGRIFQCEEHLKVGGGYDPATCLRVYFTTEQRFDGKVVIGHVGRHLDVATTT